MSRVPEPGDPFTRALAAIGVELDEGDGPGLARFLELLYEANERMNLTRIPPAEAWVKHVADSLSLLPVITGAGAKVIADVGSGGGVPALPLALCHRGPRWHLIESTEKKARFLGAAVEQLGLAGEVSVHPLRAEALGGPGGMLRGKVDLVTSRAVGRLASLVGWCCPLLRPGGIMAAIKGEQARAEVEEAAAALRAHRAAVVDLRRGPTGTVVVIEKAAR